MFKNYFIVTFRNFWRNKIFSLINVIGLAIGISASLVIFLIVNYDFTFDKFHKDGERIFRIVSIFKFSGNDSYNSGVPSPMGKAIYHELPGVEVAAAFRTEWQSKVVIPSGSNEKKVYKKENHIVYVDKNYFRLIHYNWLSGSAENSLKQPYQVVLTASKAKIYFPGLSPDRIIGRDIIFNDTVHTTVTGVVDDIKDNTDFTFNTFISRATLESTTLKPNDWEQWDNTNSASQLFIKLAPGTGVKQ